MHVASGCSVDDEANRAIAPVMEKLALPAARIVDRDGQFARQQLVADSDDDAHHLPSEGSRESHFDASPRPSVPHAPDRHVHIQHLF